MADDADLAAIRAFAAGGGKFTVDREGNIVAPIDVTPDPNAAPADAQPDAATSGKASGKASGNPYAAQREADRQADRQARIQRQAQADADRQAKDEQRQQKAFLGGIWRGASSFAENIPTPGGNLALVLILVFFAFAIIPVNSGLTRLQLIWAVLTGNASLPATGSTDSAIGANATAVANGVGTGVAAGIGVPVLTAPGVAPGIITGVASGIGIPAIGNLLEPPR